MARERWVEERRSSGANQRALRRDSGDLGLLMFLSGVPWMLLHSTTEREAERKQGSHAQRDADSEHASRPAEAVEHLAEHEAAGQAAEEVAGEVQTSGGSAVAGRGPSDEAGGDR